MQTPLAQARPFPPQLLPVYKLNIRDGPIEKKCENEHIPFGIVTSAGHADEFPVHISAISQLASFAGRHTCVDGANEHCCVQQALLSGSHTAPDLSLHVVESQQVELTPLPGSHSSPASTIPFPHIPREMVSFALAASMRHAVFVAEAPDCMREPEGSGGISDERCRYGG